MGWGCQVITDKGRQEASGVLDSASVLLAELQGALAGIKIALEQGVDEIVVYTDATRLIDLAQGRIHGPLRDEAIAERIAELREYRNKARISWVWVRGHLKHGSSGNSRADYLARLSLKQFSSKFL